MAGQDNYFFQLGERDRRDALQAASGEQGVPADVIEKDLWVVWALDALFTTPDAPRMAFKGGTSLSKVYGAIRRFSEDVDVTLSPVELAPGQDVFAADMTSKGAKRMGHLLRGRLRAVLAETVVPHLRRCARRVPFDVSVADATEDGIVVVQYPTLADSLSGYLSEGVRIEFGGRNSTEPNSRHVVTTLLGATLPNLGLPTARVDVFAAERTFWEKFTLAHAESRRPEFRASERLSRHWYDLARLGGQVIAERALADRALLEDVVRIKQLYFRSSYSAYDLCLVGQARLLPDAPRQDALRRDYEQMAASGMIYSPLPFAEMLKAVAELEDRANQAILQ
jgi:hypothetical protein